MWKSEEAATGHQPSSISELLMSGNSEAIYKKRKVPSLVKEGTSRLILISSFATNAMARSGSMNL